MIDWSFFHPTRIEFGIGKLSRISEFAEGKRLLLITSPGFTRRGISENLGKLLGSKLIKIVDTVKPNPDLEDIDIIAAELKPLAPDQLIALGGGSSLDTAKALACILGGKVKTTLTAHFRENEAFLQSDALPIIAIPTTAGTGAEVTPFGTIWDFREKKKYSIVGDDLFPKIAVLDPELTVDLPKDITISSGLDAVSHALESIWNRHASPISISFATQSLSFSLNALREWVADNSSLEARSKMLEASLLAGMAISQTRTALAHSISYPLTTAFELPHGLACSFTLPEILRFNAEVDDGRLRQLARALGHNSIHEFGDDLEKLFIQLSFRDLFWAYIPNKNRVVSLKNLMFTPGRADNNLRQVSLNDVEKIVSSSLESVYM